ncbi:uncharacterized protein FFUJ_02368 [Fusarium fujikuroi IMI 58289]|uniref:Uncharacterized protein n=1 Tax=Gibberella fujikuroi (strain CBS 195.34 / IMI 58289 / NRRL A-6831) TaxID=1279085 RepID=S0DS92_GIBF5|nr:uncharacterized protein FFUJ_02368 [Fusarium fujikuroi IMI 58289]CCT65429.1 uncharacterized protein FFUJ_02368 [Fusarium fujikuroi IMI 58289]SCO24429.1 uncharacterized protein FFM5_13672 [Fusarium fujikuroi]
MSNAMASDSSRRRRIGRPYGSKDSYAPRIKRGLTSTSTSDDGAPGEPKVLSDEWIRLKLDKKTPPPDPRYVLAREIEITSTQWPWEWTKGFEPEKWTIAMMRDLRDLIKGYQGRFNLCGDKCHPLKVGLIRSARERDKNNPKLNRDDLSNALGYYELDTKKDKKQKQVSVPCENTAATPIVVEDTPPETPHAVSRASPAPSSSSVVSNYTSASSPVSRASSVTTVTADSPGATRAESPCPTAHEDQVDATMEDDSMFVETVSDFPEYRSSSADKGEDCKSPKSKPSPQPEGMESEPSVQPQPEEPSETVERAEAHVRESVETEMQIDSDVPVHEPVAENATDSNSSSPQPQSTFSIPSTPEDIIKSLELLELQEKSEGEKLTPLLTTSKTKVQATESAMAATQGPNRKIQALCENYKIFQARKAEIVDGLEFLKGNLERRNVHPESDEYRRTLMHNNSRLQHCETTICNVQKEIEEEFKKATDREIEIRGQLEKEYAEFEQLQNKERGICRNVQYYSFIASLLRLGPLGLDSLLYKLRYSGVDVVGEVNKNSPDVVLDHVMTT